MTWSRKALEISNGSSKVSWVFSFFTRSRVIPPPPPLLRDFVNDCPDRSVIVLREFSVLDLLEMRSRVIAGVFCLSFRQLVKIILPFRPHVSQYSSKIAVCLL